MKRPTYKEIRKLEIYMSISEPLKARLRLLVVPIINTESADSLLGESGRPSSLRPMTLAKIMHQDIHASAEQTINICRDAGWFNKELQDAIKYVEK